MAAVKSIEEIRLMFPILKTEINGRPLVYLDNGATSQKPQVVIDAIDNYYSKQNANIHRGVHTLSQEATSAYEHSRNKLCAFVNAKHSHEVIFTKGTTDGINLVAAGFKDLINESHEVLISAMEHHSNIVPWQMLCERTGAKLRVMPINDDGELILDKSLAMISERTAIIALVHISNTLGTINPVADIIKEAHKHHVPVLLDGAQAVPHQSVDVQELDCDFYVFSAHKMFGPTGVGILYGKEKWLNKLPPYQGGGDMIKTVTFEKTTYNELPFKFEAGTPNIEGGIALGATVDFINEVGYDFIQNHESELLIYATTALSEISGLRIIGEAGNKASVISFIVEGVHPYDLGMILDKLGIAVRTGHHCTQPVMDYFDIPGTVRASFAFYNTIEEVDQLVIGIKKAMKMLL